QSAISPCGPFSAAMFCSAATSGSTAGVRPPSPWGHEMTESTRPKFNARLDWALVPAMVVLLMWPALWNGFPMIFPDIGGYLLRPLEGTLELGRSAAFGAYLAAGLPLDFWPNVLIQAAGTVF